jgi:prophage regulatory protein
MSNCETERFMPRPEVLRTTGFSNTTLWREVRKGRFPAPVAISPGRVGWLASAVQAWVESRASTARLQTASDPRDDQSSS